MDTQKAIDLLWKLKGKMLFCNDIIDDKSKKAQLHYCKAVNYVDQAMQELELSLLED